MATAPTTASFPGIGLREDRILRAFYRLHYLTLDEVVRLFYSEGSRTFVRATLRELAEYGYLVRTPLKRAFQRGSVPFVYALDRRGRQYLGALGYTFPHKFRPGLEANHSEWHYDHVLDVNQVLISTIKLAEREDITLSDFKHDLDLKRTPIRVPDQHGGQIVVIPDAWIDLRVGGARYCFALELDRGTEEQKKWRRKVRGYVAYMRGPYQEQYGRQTPLQVIVPTTAGSHRRDNLQHWTALELAHLGVDAARYGELFAFSDAVLTDPATFYTQPSWLLATGQRCALLEGAA